VKKACERKKMNPTSQSVASEGQEPNGPEGVKPESSSAGRGNKAKVACDRSRVFSRKHSVTPKQLACIQERFPDWIFNFGDGPLHDHPLGATERAICESLVVERISRELGKVSITDAGGNSSRHLANRRTNIHSCNPLMSSKDVIRHSTAVGNRCTNRVQDCQFVPDVYMMIHSMYYFTKDDILELLLKSRTGYLYSVVHNFDNLYGTFHHNGEYVESHYETFVENNQMKVAMKVRGNLTAYQHDPCHWLRDTKYVARGNGMCWEAHPIGDSWIYKFSLVPEDKIDSIIVDSVKTMVLVDSLNRNDHYGIVEGVQSLGDETKFKPMLEELRIRTDRIKSFGPFVWIGKDADRTVLIPKSIVQAVALKMVGTPRDKAGLRMCINEMRNAVRAEKISMPNKMRIDCCIHGAALAFVLYLEEEICSFNKLCTPKYLRMYKMLADVVSLEPVFRLSDVLNSLFCCGSTDDTSDIATVVAYNNDRSSQPGPSFDARKAWPNGLPGYESRKVLKKSRAGSSISAALRVENEDRPQFHAVAPSFSNLIPTVPCASINNEVVAISNRAIMEVPVADPKEWAEVKKFARYWIKQFRKIDATDLDQDFANWNAKFTPSKRKIQYLAYLDIQKNPLSEKDFTRSMFVKRELDVRVGAEDYDPRAIQANTDRLNVAFGPFVSLVSEQLKKLWSVDNDITYTAGMTAEEIGAWRAQFSDRNVTIIELDESRYDAHQGEDVYDIFNTVLTKCNDNYGQVSKAMKSMRKIRGYSGKGVKYTVDYTMTSGSPTTSVSNSFINGLKTSYILRKNKIPGKMIVHGDDSLIVIEQELEPKKLERLMKDFIEINRKLGFDTKAKSSTEWHEVEFCSSLFWPVEGGYVLGPKIGKRLPKIGFSLRKLDLPEVKGMIQGLGIEAGYVPVLRVYAAHCLDLLDGVKTVEYSDRRKVYKSLPSMKHEASLETDVFFFRRYSITVKEAEDSLSNILYDCITACVDFPYMDAFTTVDL